MGKVLRVIEQAVACLDRRPRGFVGALAAGFSSDDDEGAQGWLEVRNIVDTIARGAPYLTGHFPVTEHYVYSHIREAQDGKREVPRGIGLELEEYLSSPQALSEGAKYVRHLGGGRRADQLRQRVVIESAKYLLDRFDAVGVQESLSRFEERLSLLVGTRESRCCIYEKRRRSASRAASFRLTTKLSARRKSWRGCEPFASRITGSTVTLRQSTRKAKSSSRVRDTRRHSRQVASWLKVKPMS